MTTTPDSSPSPTPHRRTPRARRIALAAAGLVAFSVAGAATVWAIDRPTGDDPAEPTTTTAEPTTTTAVDDVEHDHTGDNSGDHSADHTSEAAEDVECAIPTANNSGTSGRGHTLHDSTGGRAVTEEDCEGAEAFYAEVVAEATERYADQDAAIAAGYRINREAQQSSNPLNHYRLTGGNDAVLDATAPEGLMYWDDPDTGESLLVGVVFIEFGDDLPQPGGPLTVWHDHADPEMAGPELTDPEMTDPEMTDPEMSGQGAPRMLHVWLFDNVVDVFGNGFPDAVGQAGIGRSAPLPWER